MFAVTSWSTYWPQTAIKIIRCTNHFNALIKLMLVIVHSIAVDFTCILFTYLTNVNYLKMFACLVILSNFCIFISNNDVSADAKIERNLIYRYRMRSNQLRYYIECLTCKINNCNCSSFLLSRGSVATS